jgi:hypothetical protein
MQTPDNNPFTPEELDQMDAHRAMEEQATREAWLDYQGYLSIIDLDEDGLPW